MRKTILFILLVPLVANAQENHSPEAKRFYNQATKAYNIGDSEKAMVLFQQCVETDPTYYEAYLNISKIQLSNRNYIEALSNARYAWLYNNVAHSIYSQLGICFYYNEMHDSSVHYLSLGIPGNEITETDYLYLGKSQIEIEDYSGAESSFTKAIAMNGSNAIAYNGRGNAYFNMAEYQKAENDYEKALELNPGVPGIYSNLANSALENEEPEKAFQYINEGIGQANNEEKVQLYLLKGNYYHRQGDLKNAEISYQEAYDIDNSNAIVLTNQASVDIDLENFDSALNRCNLALELQPEMMEAYFNRGIAYEMLRNTEAACIDWEQAFILGSEKAEEYLNSPICNE